MRDIIKATNQSQKAMLSFAEKTWGEKPTHKQVEVNMDSLLQPLLRILEKYDDKNTGGGTMNRFTGQEGSLKYSSQATAQTQPTQQPPLTPLRPCSGMTYLGEGNGLQEDTRPSVQPLGVESTRQLKRPETSGRLSAFLAEMDSEIARIRSQGGFQLTTFETFRRRLRASIPVKSLFQQWIRILSILLSVCRIAANRRTNRASLNNSINRIK